MIPFHDSVRSRTFPFVNVAIIAINFAVFFYELVLDQQAVRGGSELDVFIYHWGGIPSCLFDALGRNQHLTLAGARICGAQPAPVLAIFSAMFMHGGWLHILGNMLFLFIFGDNVEDAMGHIGYAIFYLLVGALAALTHAAVNMGDLTPAIGASGAIAGVMGAYVVLYPRATVDTIIVFIPLPVPAVVLIGVWFITQLFSGSATFGTDAVGAGGGVAYFAHIGGFIAGAALVHLFMIGRPSPPRARRARYG
jgi:membrane associated rhomboid family serine protease